MIAAPTCEPSYITAVRRVPTPETEPPYDGEVDDALDSPRTAQGEVQGALALAFQWPGGLPTVPALRVVPAPPGPDGPANLFDRQRTPACDLPDPRRFAARLVQAILEVAVAARPLVQLVRWTNEDVYRQLARRVRVTGHEAVTTRRLHIPGRVRSVHVSEPRDNLVEVCAIVQQSGRAAAVALRLEGIDGRWQCTALQFG
ncbi:MAG: Rv3235 family protein [Actinomycetes bacterium]